MCQPDDEQDTSERKQEDRKLSSPKNTTDTPAKSTFPISKKSKVGLVENSLPSIDESPGEDRKPQATDVVDEYCSQEVSSYLSNGLPRVSWQPQAVTSPLIEDGGPCQSYTGIINNVKDSKDTETTSTPYLTRIWKRKSRSRSEAHEDVLSSDDLDADRNNPAWLDKMYDIVAQLEDGGSRSPTPDAFTSNPSTSKGYTTVLPKSAIATPPYAKSTDVQSPIKHLANARPSPQVKAEPTSSLFGDSLDGFTTDFTLSDADLEEDNSQNSTATQNNLQSLSKGKQSTETVNHANHTEPSICAKTLKVIGDSSELPMTSCASRVKSEVKAEHSLAKVKREPTTPTRVRSENQLKKASPGTPLRRYNSYESAIKSSCPAETSTHVSSQRAVDPTQVLIEEKRQLALTKLKSRKGSLVRHKSLDSACVASQTSISQQNPSQSAAAAVGQSAATSTANQSTSKSIAEIIEEKRKMAAEKLQKHREESRERPESGSHRHLTPPGSQEPISSGVEGASDSTQSFHSQSQSDKENKVVSQVIVKSVKIKQESSLTVADSHSELFSGKLALDVLMDDLEKTSPRKNKPQKFSTQPSLNKDAKVSKTAAVVARGVESRSLSNQETSKTSRAPQMEGQPLDDNMKSIIEHKRKLALERLKQTKHQSS